MLSRCLVVLFWFYVGCLFKSAAVERSLLARDLPIGLKSYEGGAAALQFRRVRKLPDQRIMPNRLEEAERELIKRIDQRRRMP